MTRRGSLYAAVAAMAVCSAVAAGFAQEGGATTAPVSRDEFERMMKELTELRQEVTQLKQERAAASQPGADLEQLRKEVADLKKQRQQDVADAEERANEIEQIAKDAIAHSRAVAMGQTKLLITGDAAVGFAAMRGSPNTFSAGVAPRFLWKINDQLMFDAALDIGIDGDGQGNNVTGVELTIASVTYILNDHLVVGGGLFVAPFAAYHRDFDPPWINRLPDDPLVFGENGIAPGSVMGIFFSGAYPVGTTKVNYALYFANGPSLITNDPNNAGGLDLTDATDANNDKGVGGRIGWLPIPQLEVGYSFLCGDAAPDGFQHTHAFLQALDFNYTRQSEALLGDITLRSEWVWSHVNDATFGPSASPPFAPISFPNNRNGGYVMLSYRPSLSRYEVLRKFEGIVRYDRMEGPAAAPSGGGHEQRLALGLDYWLDARAVIKAAYEFDDVSNGPSAPGFMLQFGMGF